MASTVLYPPSLDSITTAFVADGDSSYCRLYFSLSKLSAASAVIKNIQLSVMYQNSGLSAINNKETTEEEQSTTQTRFRKSGILICNEEPIAVSNKTNLYYIDIHNNDIAGGWTAGTIYKIQIRVSTITYDKTVGLGQAAWLNINAGYFSEWSTYSTTKAIAKPIINLATINYNSETHLDINKYGVNSSTLDLYGSYEYLENTDKSETLYSYNFYLYDIDYNLLEETEVVYSNNFYDINSIHYLFKTELENQQSYYLSLHYVTQNKYENEFTIQLTTYYAIDSYYYINITSAESDTKHKYFSSNAVYEEQLSGRIGLKIYWDSSTKRQPLFTGNIYVRRSSSKDNFATWEDIKLYTANLPGIKVDSIPIFYDYTAESGVWYKYGLQIVTSLGRGALRQFSSPIIREYEFSYLLGEGDKQLKLQFDNTISSYAYNVIESKQETIGSKYPYINRNGNVKYRSFPLNGLISFNMDDSNTFYTEAEIYNSSDVYSLYRGRRNGLRLTDYDYIRERDFREKVLEFLQDGKPKLFKSTTEGNILVRLLDVKGSPNQTLNRMIQSFSATAYEIADCTADNYKKYNLIELEDYLDDLQYTDMHLGQIVADVTFDETNIMDLIYAKYDFSQMDLAGYRITLDYVQDISIEFNGEVYRPKIRAMREDEEGKHEDTMNPELMYYYGYKLNVNGQDYYTRADYYELDKNIIFNSDSIIKICKGDDVEIKDTYPIIVNFVYKATEIEYHKKEIATQTYATYLGQIYRYYYPKENLYKDICKKYYFDTDKVYRKLNSISWIMFDADPGTTISIKDGDGVIRKYIVNGTGTCYVDLSSINIISSITYTGTVPAGIMANFVVYTLEGQYVVQEENS